MFSAYLSNPPVVRALEQLNKVHTRGGIVNNTSTQVRTLHLSVTRGGIIDNTQPLVRMLPSYVTMGDIVDNTPTTSEDFTLLC